MVGIIDVLHCADEASDSDDWQDAILFVTAFNPWLVFHFEILF